MTSRPRLLTYVGVGFAAVGFALIAIAWGRTAGVASVAAQIPDLIAEGLTGLGLVVLGVLFINIDVRRAESAQRREHAAELLELLGTLRRGTKDGQR